MKKYRLNLYPHIINILSLLLCGTLTLLSIIDKNKGVLTIVFAVALGIAIFNSLNIIFAYNVVDEKGLFQRSMVSRKFLSWDEITQIKNQPAGKLLKASIGVSNGNKTINITNWTKDYESLLKSVVEKSTSNRNVQIDRNVLELIND